MPAFFAISVIGSISVSCAISMSVLNPIVLFSFHSTCVLPESCVSFLCRPAFFVDFHKNLSASAAFFAIKKLRKKDIPKIHLNAVAEAIP